MRDLADAAKHHKLDRKSVTLKSIVGAEGGGRLESFSPLGMTTSDDRGSLEIVQRDGSRHDPYEVFRSVIQFWQSEVKK